MQGPCPIWDEVWVWLSLASGCDGTVSRGVSGMFPFPGLAGSPSNMSGVGLDEP